jgi:hypothetical protein
MAPTELPEPIAQLVSRNEPIVVVDREGVVVLMTAAAADLWDVDPDAVVGEFVEMLVPSKLRWGHQAYRRGFLAEPSQRDMAEGMAPSLERPSDEVLVPINVHLEPLEVDGNPYVAAHVSVRHDE